MSWFAAHVVLYVKLKKEAQERYPVWENIVLLEAGSEEEAFSKAEQRGREEEGEDGTLRWGGEPAEWVFAGVRKITSCEEREERPEDGTEISYTELEVDSLASVERLVAGEPVAVKYQDRFAEAD